MNYCPNIKLPSQIIYTSLQSTKNHPKPKSPEMKGLGLKGLRIMLFLKMFIFGSDNLCSMFCWQWIYFIQVWR